MRYDNGNYVVAPLVAMRTSDKNRVCMIIPEDLREIINSWGALTESMRTSILTMIRAAIRQAGDMGDERLDALCR